MAWDAAPLSFSENVARAHEEDPATFPADTGAYTRELGVNGTGFINLIPIAGIDHDLRRDDIILYIGSDGGDPTPRQYRLFDYDPAVDEGAEVLVDGHAQGPDDPDVIAPRVGVELWVLEVKEVVSLPVAGQGGVTLRRTHVFGHSFATGRYLKRAYPARWPRIADVLEDLHPREHVKTDLWQYLRADTIIAVGELRSPSDWYANIPPPTPASDSVVRIWIRPGCVHHLDIHRNHSRRQALVFRSPPGIARSTCSAADCDRPGYDRGGDSMARCPGCELWFHTRCCKDPDGADLDDLWVYWRGGAIQAPAVRRVPNEEEPRFAPAARGLLLRVDPPVRSWERVAAAIFRARDEVEHVEKTDGAVFRRTMRAYVRSRDKGPQWLPLSDEETVAALRALESEDIEDPHPILECPLCETYM